MRFFAEWDAVSQMLRAKAVFAAHWFRFIVTHP